MSADNRTLNLIVRPVNAPKNGELKKTRPTNKVTFAVCDWNGEPYWFEAELARVWTLELDD